MAVCSSVDSGRCHLGMHGRVRALQALLSRPSTCIDTHLLLRQQATMQAVSGAGLRTCLPPLATQPGPEAGRRCVAKLRLCPARPTRRSDWAAAAAAPGGRRNHRRAYRRPLPAVAASSGEPGSPDYGGTEDERVAAAVEKLAELGDLNKLQTALNTAISAEDWALAAKLRDLLRMLTGAEGQGGAKLAADWKGLGILPWLAERAENLGFSFPTGARDQPPLCSAHATVGDGLGAAWHQHVCGALRHSGCHWPGPIPGPPHASCHGLPVGAAPA